MSHIQDIARELATQDDVHPVLTTIDSGCTAIQHLAIRRLEALCNQNSVMGESLQREILQAPTARRLNAICSLNRRQWSEPILSHMLPKLQQYDPLLQKSIARLACRQFPEQVHDLIQKSTKQVARVLRFHAIVEISTSQICICFEQDSRHSAATGSPRCSRTSLNWKMQMRMTVDGWISRRSVDMCSLCN